jgi:hypothetical protein
MADKCYACDRTLGKKPRLVDTRDAQAVYVGRECYKMIEAAGERGYQPPRGGPRLYLLKLCDGCNVRSPWEHRCHDGSGKISCACVQCREMRLSKHIDQKDLIQKLAPFPGGAPSLLGKGRSMQELRGRPLHQCIASIVVDIYNKGRSAGKLDAWES